MPASMLQLIPKRLVEAPELLLVLVLLLLDKSAVLTSVRPSAVIPFIVSAVSIAGPTLKKSTRM